MSTQFSNYNAYLYLLARRKRASARQAALTYLVIENGQVSKQAACRHRQQRIVSAACDLLVPRAHIDEQMK
jgi:hypothetical protein